MSKIILITGTSNGFGYDAAKTLAAAGHRVFASMRDASTRHQKVAKELQASGIEVLELDVTKQASVDAAFEALYAKTNGKLDVVVNNAGLMAQGISETFSPEQMRDMFDVNVFGVQRVIRAALPKMRSAGSGLIVNVGSILGRVTIPFVGLYGASKHALEAMTDSYRYELSQLGIDVVLVQPSAYPTSLYHSVQKATDGDLAGAYGAVADVPVQFVAYLQGLFAGENAPDPHDVAKALVELVGAPAGKRPDRVVVGAPFGADAANIAIHPIQAGLISGLGMDALSRKS